MPPPDRHEAGTQAAAGIAGSVGKRDDSRQQNAAQEAAIPGGYRDGRDVDHETGVRAREIVDQQFDAYRGGCDDQRYRHRPQARDQIAHHEALRTGHRSRLSAWM